jgi:hypothetical protein
VTQSESQPVPAVPEHVPEHVPDAVLALGAFGWFWDAWDAADDAVKALPFRHFPNAAYVQFVELAEHLAAGDRLRAAREATDVISVALNTLRWLGFQPDEVAVLALERAAEPRTEV